MNQSRLIRLDDQAREYLVLYDYGYFLERHLSEGSYTDEQIQAIYLAKDERKRQLRQDYKKNKKQVFHYIDAMIALSMDGGALASMLRLTASREYTILDFKATGEEWATFEMWRKLQRRKLFWAKSWERIIRLGSLLAFILTVIKISEYLKQI